MCQYVLVSCYIYDETCYVNLDICFFAVQVNRNVSSMFC